MITTIRLRIVRSAMAVVLALSSAAGSCYPIAGGDDVRPTPEDVLRSAGIEPSIEVLTATLFDENQDARLRFFSALALGRTRKAEVVPSLLEALQTTNLDVRGGVLTALYDVPDPRSIPQLAAIVSDPAQEELHSPAIGALCAIRTAEAANVLVLVALDVSSPYETRRQSTQRLGECEVPSITDQLRTLLRGDDKELRLTAAISMAQLGDPSGIQLLAAASQDPLLPDGDRVVAGQALEYVTHQDFGFRFPGGRVATGDDIDLALQRIATWWEKNKAAYQ